MTERFLATAAETGCVTTSLAAPKRIQRRRTKGWRMPEGAVYVGRPTGFGNPFHGLSGMRRTEPASTVLRRVEVFRDWLTRPQRSPWFGVSADEARRRLLDGLPSLRGHDLVCWCPLDQPCHADVLLELANA